VPTSPDREAIPAKDGDAMSQADASPRVVEVLRFEDLAGDELATEIRVFVPNQQAWKA
jgi:hypothetical protein